MMSMIGEKKLNQQKETVFTHKQNVTECHLIAVRLKHI